MRMVTGLFTDVPGAEKAIQALTHSGIAPERMSLVYHEPEYKGEGEGRDGIEATMWETTYVIFPDVGTTFVAGPLLLERVAAAVGDTSGGTAGTKLEGLEQALGKAGFSEGLARANTEAVRRGRPLILVEAAEQLVAHVRSDIEQGEGYNIGVNNGEHCVENT